RAARMRPPRSTNPPTGFPSANSEARPAPPAAPSAGEFGGPESAPQPSGKADLDVAGADGADDGIPVARGVDLDPGATEVRRSMRIVGGDLHQGNRLGVVQGPVEPGVGHLDRRQRPAGCPDGLDALERLVEAQL